MRSYTPNARQQNRRQNDRRNFGDRRQNIRGDRGFGKKLGVWCAAALAVMLLLAANLWMQSAPQKVGDVSLDKLRFAYASVVTGQTQAPQLARLGFDASRPGVKRLAYLGLMEFFAPKDSRDFDRLAPAAQKCLATPNGCRAYIFRLARQTTTGPQSAFAFVSAAEAAQAPGIEVTFLIHDGRVAYKAMRNV